MSNKKTHKKPTKLITNRRARYDYTIGDTLVCGIMLTGAETKQLRLGHGQLTGAYVTIKNNELYLLNALISSTNQIPIKESEQTRSRKLLAKKSEIKKLIEAKLAGNTLIPLEFITNSKFIKLKIAIAKGKKNYDKRAVNKKRDQQREIDLKIKNKY